MISPPVTNQPMVFMFTNSPAEDSAGVLSVEHREEGDPYM
jgi:hypothetical protein